MIESLVVTELIIHRVGADERGGRISLRLEKLGHGGKRVVQDISVLDHPMHDGIEGGKQRRVGRSRCGHGGVGHLEADALFRQGVQPGGGLPEIPVAGTVIRPQGVDGDQDEARRAGGCGRTAAEV